MKKSLLSLTLLVLSLCASAQGVGKYVGGDISMLPKYEAAGDKYLDGDGNENSDLITWLTTECGWNTFRVRLFVNPQQKGNDGSADLSVCQDLDYVTALGKRIKAAGAKFMLDFHYSDTYVDATHIQKPAAWAGLTNAQLITKLGEYTSEVLQHLNDNNATPDFVQVGNEIMYGLCDIKVHPYNATGDNWTDYIALLKAGCNAVRAKCPNAQIIIHTDRPTNTTYNTYYYNKLINGGVDFDVIGLSYYPFWHGVFGSLQSALASLNTNFSTKKVQIVESAYYYQYWPNAGISYDTRTTWPCSEDGQYKFVSDLLNLLKSFPQVEGYNYWFPEEAGNGVDNSVASYWVNRGFWWNTNQKHWPIKATSGMVHYKMKDFLDPNATGITSVEEGKESQKNGAMYSTTGQRVDENYKGLVIQNGKKFIKR